MMSGTIASCSNAWVRKSKQRCLDLELGLGLAEDGFAVAHDDELPNSLGNQMKAFRGLSSGKDSFDPIEPTKDFRRGLGVFGRAKPDVAGATEGAVMLDILITLGREGEPEFSMRAYMR